MTVPIFTGDIQMLFQCREINSEREVGVIAKANLPLCVIESNRFKHRTKRAWDYKKSPEERLFGIIN